MNVLRLAAAAGAAAVLALAVTAARTPEPAEGAATAVDDGITVTGVATVETVPDRAQFSFGVEARARTAAAALEASGGEMRKVVAALRAAGIAAADIRTQHISVSQRTNDEGERVPGFVGSTAVSVVVRDLDRAGEVIDAAVRAGATAVEGPALVASDARRLYRAALERAYADARAKAQELAAAAGLRLGPATVIAEGQGMPIAEARGGNFVAAASADVEPGTESFDARVTVTFAVN